MIFNEKRLMVTNQGFKLQGTLATPEGSSDHAVIIMPGSGQVNQDGNHKKFQSNLYRDLAYFLYEIGVPSLRFDKRGTGMSEGTFNETGLSDFISDAAVWMRELKKHYNRITLIGHSEGAITGPAVMKLEPADGFIFLCGFMGTGEELIAYQRELLQKEVQQTTGFKKYLFKILRVEKNIEKSSKSVDQKIAQTTAPAIKYRGTTINAKWIREMKAYHITDFMNSVPCRSLAIEGARDIQIKPGSAAEFASFSGAEHIVISDMNHILRRRDRPHSLLGLQKEYQKDLRDKDLHPELLKQLKIWFSNSN
ncbi:alpha/beta hydrolase [Jeotgalibacillus haloalkalitolerans]|uniref:Alpha/beta hydrolase n=1 Tax=Jeotgalibacillus haloalkalitolerans TaxID=3104292 RepID=A0ABU5KHP7_9BACL|nr:alpha/beta hydrolase [Jeotgalibacillus sp. HH7-29]MDZ5710750.1 alpha/beta hydrolase [Jeotgalibacillus sp. HH7-29]